MDVIDEPSIYRGSVPIFRAVLDRMEAELARAEAQLGAERLAEALTQRPAPEMITTARQVATAAQFTVRIAYPLAGRRAPELRGGFDAAGLRLRIEAAREALAEFGPADFAEAAQRMIRFQAGFADLELPGEVYLHAFGLPNLYFHHAMAHVALKQAGVRLGKADFDGLHDYPEGFSFG
jgi:hypothetical protein